MKKQIYSILLSLLLTTTAAAMAQREPADIFAPSNRNLNEKLPVILLLHGYTGSGKLMNMWFRLGSYVNSRKFILIVPNGNKDGVGMRYWNATDGCCDFAHSGVDDVGYLQNLVTDTIAKYNGDPNRVYAVGHSNGGFMAHRLACDKKHMFRAIVSFAGETFKNESDCESKESVSILQIHALDDETIKFDGDPVGYPMLQPYPGTRETVSRYLGRDGCELNYVAGPDLNISSSNPGNDTHTFRWNCLKGTRVEMWVVDPHKSPFDSAHTPLLWPEFTVRILDFLLGQDAP